jgi:hypothetical protein
LGSNGALVNLAANQSLILRNVSLNGMSGNSRSLVSINGGEMVMRDGAISGNMVNSSGSNGGGVSVDSGGSFTMYGGIISGNTVSGGGSGSGSGGGVNVTSSGNFTMYGGIISGNTTTAPPTGYGGGVFVDSGGSFTKTGGTIYGDTDTTNVPPENTAAANGRGHAVYHTIPFGFKYRDSTHGPTDGTLSTSNTSSPPWDM